MGGVLLLLADGASIGTNLSIFDPASPSAESIRDLSFLIFAITGLIFVLVEGVLIYALIRFRQAATLAGNEPPQVYGSKAIEIAWTAAPGMIVFIILLVTTRTLWQVKVIPREPQSGDNTLFVTVVGRQWWWEYHYDQYNGRKLDLVTANELHIPVSEKGVPRAVYLTLKSADVCHSFWVPRLGGKTDLIPGRTNSMWLQTDQKGLFLGQCAEYCGTQHANMLIRVVVDSPDEFEQWLDREAKPAADDTSTAKGREVFLSQSCVNCHRVRGTTAEGTYAPDLTHLMGRATLASGMVPNTPENLRKWIDDPQQVKPGCLMPAFGLSDQDHDQLIRYLQTLQ